MSLPRTLIALLAAALPALAQLGGEEVAPELAKLKGRVVSVEPAEAKRGETVVAKVELEVPQGWHIYGLTKGTSGVPTEFTATKGPVRVRGGVKEPTPKHKYQKYEGTDYVEEYDYHEGAQVVFEVPLEVLSDAAPGAADIALSVRHMLCTESMCLDETTVQVTGKLTVAEGGGPAKDPELEGKIVSLTPPGAKMGDKVVARVRLVVPKGWHIYSVKKSELGVPTTFAVKKGPFRLDGDVKEPAPKRHKAGTLEYDAHEGEPEFDVPLLVTGDAKPGLAPIEIEVGFGLCTEGRCKDPATLVLASALTVQPGGTAPPPPDDGKGKKPSLWAFLGLAVGTGLVTLITPCVFPMIPITISFFTKQSAGSRGGTFGMAAAYGIGIVASYTAIGFVVSALLGEQGATTFAGNPWVNLLICAIFVLFAFTLFGWFELTLPSAFTNALSAQGKGGYVGALALGLTFAITAFTCAAPFAALLLGLAVQGERAWALLGFLTYSATMAVPFFLLGLFPNALKALPRSGGWLNAVKVVMGFIELAAACKFLANADVAWQWNFVSRSGVLAAWVACSGFAALYLLGLFRLDHDEPAPAISVPRMLWALLFGGIALWLGGGLVGRHLGIVEAYLPLPEQNMWIGGGGGGSGGGGEAHQEYDSHSAALAAGKAERKPIFLEFTAFN